jgi:hypothetical protein
MLCKNPTRPAKSVSSISHHRLCHCENHIQITRGRSDEMVSSSLNDEDKVRIAHELRQTVRELRDRGLLVSAKWSATSFM